MEVLDGCVQGGALAALVCSSGFGFDACLIVNLAFLAGIMFERAYELLLFLILCEIGNLVSGSIMA